MAPAMQAFTTCGAAPTTHAHPCGTPEPSMHLPLHRRRSQGIRAPPEASGRKRQRSSSRFVGVTWHKASSSWYVQLRDAQTTRKRFIGQFASEEDAGRAYDHVAVQVHGPGGACNFPGEAISELPVTMGEERKQRQSSHYIGVSWHKANASWNVRLTDPQTKRKLHFGCYASEEDAARAYDHAAVQALGAGAERNFPDETISEVPATVGEERKQRTSSRFTGVSWNKSKSAWSVNLTDPQTKLKRSLGYFAIEEDAARAYDRGAVQARGPGTKLNFPGEAISELPVVVGDSRYIGVSWDKTNSAWLVKLQDPQTKRRRNVGRYASEEDAARAYDCAAVQARGPGVGRNFPGEANSELPVSLGEERKHAASSSTDTE
jgi:hypothetical protein